MTKSQTPRQIAKTVRSALEYISVYWPAVASEMERVLNLGIPLAEAFHHDMISSVTPAGKDALWGTWVDLLSAIAALQENPALADTLPALWDVIFASRGTVDLGAVESEITQTAFV